MHLTTDEEASYFERCRTWLGEGGLAVLLVPASPADWGIEDEIAGHRRRYTRERLLARLSELAWAPRHIAGLTYPLSNVLLPASNRLVARAESRKRTLSLRERTRVSGVRGVPLKTDFPRIFGLLLNRVTLYPFHLLQRRNRANDKALVLYAECTPLEQRASGA